MARKSKKGRRYCEDCIFIRTRSGEGTALAQCGETRAGTGTPGNEFVAREFDQPRYVSAIRSNENLCGPDAKWFSAAVIKANLIFAAGDLLKEAKVLRTLEKSRRLGRMTVRAALAELSSRRRGHDGGAAISKATKP